MRELLNRLVALFSLIAFLVIAAAITFSGKSGSIFDGIVNGTSEMLHAIGQGFVILFCTSLGLGIAYGVIYGIKLWHGRHAQVFRDGKEGQIVRAVLVRDQVIQIGSSEGIGLSEMMKMQTQIAVHQQKMMQVVGASATAMQRLANLEDDYEDEEEEPLEIEGPESALPNLVHYEDIRQYIPQDHALVGVGGEGVITRQRAIKALTWIVGGSGTGKTNSVCLRVDEDYEWGHRFLVIDPHWFKHDSMYNAIKIYADRFLMPVAYEVEDILKVLDTFLNEFKRRKSGASWEFPITILIDEVGSLTTDTPETDQEKEMIAKIKQVARICGQESRGFDMTGMYISQDAAGLAWLRKRALLVLAHQLLMMSERLLATNKNAEVSRAMDDWPKGRTLVYGIGIQEGQMVVQQPIFQARIVDSTIEKPASKQSNGDFSGSGWEANGEAAGSSNVQNSPVTDITVVKELREIGKRLKNGEDKTKIVKSYGLPWGRATQELSATVDLIEKQMLQTGEL